jgi:hypothetical protein
MSTSSSSSGSPADAPPAAGWLIAPPLRMTLLDARGERDLAAEFVCWSDLHDCVAEAWLAGSLRRGRPDQVPDYRSLRLRPQTSASGLCSGFTIIGADSGGARFEMTFAVHTLEPLADRLAAGLVAQGALAAAAPFRYVVQVAVPPAGDPAATDAPPCRLPLVVVRLPLRPLLARARRVDAAAAEPADFFPVIFTADCLRLTEKLCRSGARLSPAVESGCALVGALASCPESGDLGAVVFDVLEIKGAEASATALRPSATSWSLIHRALRARQSQPRLRAHRLLGVAHGHPFPPAGDQCPGCRLRTNCDKSSAFLSREDVTFFRSAFAGMPWQLAPVFGQTARGEPVHEVFGLNEGRLQARSYHVLDDAAELAEPLALNLGA